MKKINQLFITILFFMIILISFVKFFFIGTNFDNEVNYEKRTMKEKPVFDIKNINNFGSDYEGYFNDHFPYRSQIILVNKNIKYELFQYVEGDVLVGKNQWLFFNPKVGENTINDYQGKDLFTDEELVNFKNVLVFSNDVLKNKNKKFYLFFAPNKNRIYSEYFPEIYGKPADTYKLKNLIEYLKTNTDIDIVYAYDDLMRAKSILTDKTIYHQYDTHWNNIGGYVGAYSLLKNIGIDIPFVDDNSFSAVKTKGNLADLAYMAGLYNLIDKDIDYEISFTDFMKPEKIADENGEVVIYKNENAVDDRKILFICDSFAEMYREYIASQFTDSYFISYLVFNQDLIKTYNPDIVVFESLERTITNRLKFFGISNID